MAEVFNKLPLDLKSKINDYIIDENKTALALSLKVNFGKMFNHCVKCEGAVYNKVLEYDVEYNRSLNIITYDFDCYEDLNDYLCDPDQPDDRLMCESCCSCNVEWGPDYDPNDNDYDDNSSIGTYVTDILESDFV